MKRTSLGRILTTLMLTVALALGAVSVLAGCNDPPPPPPAPTLESIKLETDSVKTEFDFAETFTYAGLKVKAVMSDSSEKDIDIAEVRVQTPNMESEGRRNVTVTYAGKTARYAITVKPRVFPEITGEALLTITEENTTNAFRVEGEAIDMRNVKKADGAASFIADAPNTEPAPAEPAAQDESGTEPGTDEPATEPEAPETTYGITSGGKYLTGFGVKYNYFGFKVNAAKQFENVTMVLRLANSGNVDIAKLGDSVAVYLNRNVTEDGEVEGLIERDDTVDAGLCKWRDVVARKLTLKEGDNTVTFDVLGDLVPDIDYIDFYVGKRYISSVVSLSEVTETPIMVDLEDFDTEKAKTDPKWAAANSDKMHNGVGLEPATKIRDGWPLTSRGTSIAAMMSGSEFSTTLRVAQDATVKIGFIASSDATHIVKNMWEFIIDGHKLMFVEEKNIQYSVAGGYYWNWMTTDLGTYNIAAGDHLLEVKLTGTKCNVDGLIVEVLSMGEYAEGGIPVDNQEAYLPHVCESACLYCDKCKNPDCEREECAEKCTAQHVVMEAEDLDGSTTNKRIDFNAGQQGGVGFNVGNNPTASGGKSTYGFTGVTTGSLFEATVFAVKVTATEACTVDIYVRVYGDTAKTFAENLEFAVDGVALTQANPDAKFTPNQQWHNVCVAKNVELGQGEHTFTMKVISDHFDFDCIFFQASEGNTTPLTVAAMVYNPNPSPEPPPENTEEQQA